MSSRGFVHNISMSNLFRRIYFLFVCVYIVIHIKLISWDIIITQSTSSMFIYYCFISCDDMLNYRSVSVCNVCLLFNMISFDNSIAFPFEDKNVFKHMFVHSYLSKTKMNLIWALSCLQEMLSNKCKVY